MKKIYLMGLSAMLALSVNAQTALRVKNSTPQKAVDASSFNGSVAKTGTPNQIHQVYGNLVCNTQLVAGTTMDLEFVFTQTGNTDEYIDMFSITFPTGVTPTGLANTSDPFPSAGAGQPVATATLNPIAGQTISWGDAIQSGWGAIHTNAGVGMSFTVNVTVAPSVTGVQTASYTATGDTYTTTGNPTPGDLNGTVTMYDGPFTNIFAKLVQPSGITGVNNCGMTATHTIIARYINKGTATESNIDLNYSINGVTGVAGQYPGPLLPGDSITIGLGVEDFSADNLYDIKAWANIPGDIDMNNDTAIISITNSNSVPLTSATFSNGVESVYEYASVNRLWQGTGLRFAAEFTEVHSGVGSFAMKIPAGLATATYTSLNVYPCVDVVNGEQYRVSFWKKATAGLNVQTAITTGTANSTAGTATILKTYSLSPTSTVTAAWVKDSVTYTATATGTRYFSIRGRGTANTTTAMNLFIDDVMIEKIIPTGIKTNSLDLENVSIFPNPSTGILNINTIDATTSVEIFNVIGEKVYSSKNLNKGNNVVDLSNLANGSYFVKMSSNNNVTTKKVVLSK